MHGEKRLRTLTLMEGDDIMQLALWEKHCDVDVNVNDHIQANWVVISEFNNKKQLESSVSFHVECLTEDEEMVGQVIAVSSDEFEVPYDVVFLAQDREYEVMVTEQSIVDIDMCNLPVMGRIAITHDGTVTECVSLRKQTEEDAD